MASEYSVNIKLNTQQVKNDLKTIGTEIANLGKKEARSSKTALSTTDKRLKAETQVLNLQTKIQGTVNNLLKADLKGVQAEKIRIDLIRLRNNVTQKNLISSQKELALLKQKISLESQPRAPLGGRFGIQRGFDFQSALISGGFPLLFGQGPVGALAGGLGGGIGGMFGQMGGFAGGIAATAALQQITTLTQEIGKLGNALARPTENIGTLVEKLGLTNDPAGRLALKLEKLGLTSSASALLMEKFTEKTGKSPDALSKATQEINEMNEELATLTLKFQLFAAEALTPIISLLNKVPYDQLVKLAQFRLNMSGAGLGAAIGKQIFKGKGGSISNIPASEGNAVIGGTPLNPNFGKSASDIALTDLAKQTQFNKEIQPLKQALAIEKERLTLSSTQLTLKKEQNKLDIQNQELEVLKKEQAIQTNAELDFKIQKLTAEKDLQEQILLNAKTLADPVAAQTIELQKQMDVLMDRGHQIVALSQTISTSFAESFKGIIKGTMSVGDAFRNMLNRMADHFLDMAAQMMANQFQQGILGLIAGSLGGGGQSSVPFITDTNLSGNNASDFLGGPNPFTPKAMGGPVKGGGSYIVGEKGPELFTPGVSGNITPNHKLGGSTNVVVNVDASGSSVQGDDQSAIQLGELVGAAVQAEIVKQQMDGGLLS